MTRTGRFFLGGGTRIRATAYGAASTDRPFERPASARASVYRSDPDAPDLTALRTLAEKPGYKLSCGTPEPGTLHQLNSQTMLEFERIMATRRRIEIALRN